MRGYSLIALHCAGSGHTGGTLSAMDIVSVLYLRTMKHKPAEPEWGGRDRLFFSAGHKAPAWYVPLGYTGYFDVLQTALLRKNGSPFCGHPDRKKCIGISSSASSGYYTIPLTLTTAEGQKATYVSGVVVEATPQITVSLDTTGATPQIQVANTGNSQIRSVHVSATAAGSSAPTDSFIGTLNVDDFSSVALPSGSARSVDVEVTFKDSNNAQRTIKQTLDTNGNVSFTQGGARTGFAASGNGSPQANAARGGNNPFGFLLGGRTGGSAPTGPNYVVIGIVIVIVAAGGFLVYRHFKKGKKLPLHLPFQPAKNEEKKK